MSKIFVYDLETTGVKYWKNGIHQISGMVVIDGEVKETINLKVQPNPTAVIEPEALAVGNVTEEDFKGYMPFQAGYVELVKVLSKYVDKFNKKDKFFLCGYNNASFDNDFLRALFVQNNDNYFGSWFWANSIDVMVLATVHLMANRKKMENFKLKTVAQEMGIEVDESKLHDAKYDLELTYQIYQKIV
jgi:DNA polymerase-3 subunit epsilon